MSFIVVILLAALWALLLLPGMFRGHRSSSPQSSVNDFGRSMDVLAAAGHRSGGSQVLHLPSPRQVEPRSGVEAARRRRAVLLLLGSATVVSTLFAVLGVRAFWPVAGLFLLGTGSYVGMAVYVVRQQELRRQRVRRLPSAGPVGHGEAVRSVDGVEQQMRQAAGWHGTDIAVEGDRGL